MIASILECYQQVHFVRVQAVHNAFTFTFTAEKLKTFSCFNALFKNNWNVQVALPVTNIKHMIQRVN